MRYTRHTRQLNHRPAYVIGVVAVLLMFTCLAPATAEERRIALVVGNGAYAQTPLRNTINDARAMTESLENLGFKVIMRLNATQKEMIRAIYQFGSELEKGGIGLFYYAGHAVQIRGKNFMIPVGARISVEDHVEPESVNLYRVLGRMGGARNRLNIVILDACRDNPFGESFRYYSEGLAQTRAPANSFIAYAAAPGELAADGTGVNSFYTGALLEAMAEPGLTLEETFKKVSTGVRKATRGLQIPWTSSSFNEDFYFKPPVKSAKGKDAENRSKAIDRELVFWQVISGMDSQEYFDAYLSHFPDGLFTIPAQIKLSERRTADNAQSAADRDPNLGKGLLAAIDRTLEDEKSGGADYILQFESAVRSGSDYLRRREEMKRQAEAAQKQVMAAGKEKAEKQYKEKLAQAERNAAAAEQRLIAEASKKADAERQRTIDDATGRYERAAILALTRARKGVEERTLEAVAAAEKQAAEDRRNALAAAKSKAEEEHRKSMAEAEAAAEQMRRRMIAVAKDKADKALQRQLSKAKRDSEQNQAALLAKLKKDAEDRKARDLEVAEKRYKADAAAAIAAVERKAAEDYEAAIVSARKSAEQERERILAEARKAAEAERQAQVANLAPATPADANGGRAAGKAKAPAKKAVPDQDSPPADERPPSLKTLGLGDDVPAELRREIGNAMKDARKRGQGRQGQMMAALQAIKKYRDANPSTSKASPSAGGTTPPPAMSFGLANANPEYKEIIEKTMTRARADGMSFDDQVRAALDAVKEYRDRETKTKEQRQ